MPAGFDAPLNSDIEALSRSLKSGTEDPQFYRTTRSVDTIVDDACAAVAAAGRGIGQISTLILPADVSWADNAPEPRRAAISARTLVSESRIEKALAILQRCANITVWKHHGWRAPPYVC